MLFFLNDMLAYRLLREWGNETTLFCHVSYSIDIIIIIIHPVLQNSSYPHPPPPSKVLGSSSSFSVEGDQTAPLGDTSSGRTTRVNIHERLQDALAPIAKSASGRSGGRLKRGSRGRRAIGGILSRLLCFHLSRVREDLFCDILDIAEISFRMI